MDVPVATDLYLHLIDHLGSFVVHISTSDRHCTLLSYMERRLSPSS